VNPFDAPALATLTRSYPEQPVLLDHGLVGHELLTLEALAGLAARMRAADVEYNRGDLPVGVDPSQTPANGLSIEETIRRIEDCGSWMVLKSIEQDEPYRTLLHDMLAAVEPAVHEATGAMLKREGFIFISSPGAVTPFHFDPEHNILVQIRGGKTMTIFPPDDEELVSGAEHERFHAGGHRNLPWQEAFAARGKPFQLTPGKAVYVPVKAPHWVQNGPKVSISLSITWRSQWSYREESARRWNQLLRGAGVQPRAPRRWPHQNHAKALGFKLVDKAGIARSRTP